MLTNLRDAFRGQSMSPNIVPEVYWPAMTSLDSDDQSGIIYWTAMTILVSPTGQRWPVWHHLLVTCKVRTGPTPRFQPLGELRTDSGNLRVSTTGSHRFYTKGLTDVRVCMHSWYILCSDAALSTNQQLIQPSSTNSIRTLGPSYDTLEVIESGTIL